MTDMARATSALNGLGTAGVVVLGAVATALWGFAGLALVLVAFICGQPVPWTPTMPARLAGNPAC